MNQRMVKFRKTTRLGTAHLLIACNDTAPISLWRGRRYALWRVPSCYFIHDRTFHCTFGTLRGLIENAS